MTVKPKLEAMTDDELLAERQYLYSTLDTVYVNIAAGQRASIATWERINDIDELLLQRDVPLTPDERAELKELLDEGLDDGDPDLL